MENAKQLLDREAVPSLSAAEVISIVQALRPEQLSS